MTAVRFKPALRASIKGSEGHAYRLPSGAVMPPKLDSAAITVTSVVPARASVRIAVCSLTHGGSLGAGLGQISSCWRASMTHAGSRAVSWPFVPWPWPAPHRPRAPLPPRALRQPRAPPRWPPPGQSRPALRCLCVGLYYAVARPSTCPPKRRHPISALSGLFTPFRGSRPGAAPQYALPDPTRAGSRRNRRPRQSRAGERDQSRIERRHGRDSFASAERRRARIESGARIASTSTAAPTR